MFGSAESEKDRLIIREIIFAKLQRMTTTLQRHRQTDGRTDGQHTLTIRRSAIILLFSHFYCKRKFSLAVAWGRWTAWRKSGTSREIQDG